MDSDYLVHHGIIGQKWGVRRFQNYDGTYTQKGLARYNKSREKYEASREAYKSARRSGDKSAVSSSKKQMKADRAQMNKDYKRLKQDNLADQGRELYKSGKTITGGNLRLSNKIFAVGLASLATRAYISKSSLAGKTILTKFGAVNVADLAAASVAVGGAAIAEGMSFAQENRNRKLRAYYGH